MVKAKSFKLPCGVLDQFVSQGGKNLVLLGSRCKNDTVKIDNMFLFDGGKSG